MSLPNTFKKILLGTVFSGVLIVSPGAFAQLVGPNDIVGSARNYNDSSGLSYPAVSGASNNGSTVHKSASGAVHGGSGGSFGNDGGRGISSADAASMIAGTVAGVGATVLTGNSAMGAMIGAGVGALAGLAAGGAGGAPAIVNDVGQVEQLVQMNRYHVDQVKILDEIKQEIINIKDAIGPGSGGQDYYSSAPGLGVGGPSGFGDYGSSSSVLKSNNDIDKMAEEIKSAMMKNGTTESAEEAKKRLNNKKKYVSEVVVQGMATAINIRDGVAETDKVIKQMAELSEESSGTTIQDISINNRILVEVLKYVAQMGVATAINAELVAVDYLNKDDSL